MTGAPKGKLGRRPVTNLTFSSANLIGVEFKAGFFMSIDGHDIREIGIWLLLLAFAFVAIMLPLLSVDAPDATAAVTFTLILTLEILFVFSPNRQLLVCAGHYFGICPRSPPSR
jgi:hypothetical protein